MHNEGDNDKFVIIVLLFFLVTFVLLLSLIIFNKHAFQYMPYMQQVLLFHTKSRATGALL